MVAFTEGIRETDFQPILITCDLSYLTPKDYREPCNEVESLNSAERSSEIRTGTFRSGVDILSHCATFPNNPVYNI